MKFVRKIKIHIYISLFRALFKLYLSRFPTKFLCGYHVESFVTQSKSNKQTIKATCMIELMLCIKTKFKFGLGSSKCNINDFKRTIPFVESLFLLFSATPPHLGALDVFLPLLSSVCVCTLTHSSAPRSPWSLGRAQGFEAVVKAWGHEEGRGVIMRSSPQLLLPNLPSSPFVLFHVHATYLCFLSQGLPSSTSPLFLSFHPLTSVNLSLSPILASAPLSRGSFLPTASSSLPSLAHNQREAGSLTPSEQ